MAASQRAMQHRIAANLFKVHLVFPSLQLHRRRHHVSPLLQTARSLTDHYRRPGLYSCEPCLRKAIDWIPKKQIPEICIDEEDFNREEFLCEACDQVCYDYLEKKSYAGCDGGTQRMGSLLERFIKHIKVNRRMAKEEYNSHPKTIRLRKKARRAMASHSNRSDADTMKDHRAEHKRAVATNTLSTLIDISNSLRVIARTAVYKSNSNAIKMPPRCGPEEMPEECLWKFPLDENEDEEN